MSIRRIPATGPTLNRNAVVPALAFGAVVLALGLRLQLGGLVAAVLVGVLSSGVATWWLANYAKASRVEQFGDCLLLSETRSRERLVGERAHGAAIVFSDVRGGVAGYDSWMLWFDDDGVGLWTAMGRRWPIDSLLDACQALDIPVQTVDEPHSPAAIRHLYPNNVRWIEAHTMVAVSVVTLGGLLMFGVAMALAGIDLSK